MLCDENQLLHNVPLMRIQSENGELFPGNRGTFFLVGLAVRVVYHIVIPHGEVQLDGVRQPTTEFAGDLEHLADVFQGVVVPLRVAIGCDDEVESLIGHVHVDTEWSR